MEFGFVEEISEDVVNKSSIITVLSQRAEEFFETKEYGAGIRTLIIRIICVAPVFDSFCKPLKKYSRTKKQLEYGVKINHEKFQVASEDEIVKMVGESIINSLNIIEKLNVKDFDLDQFKADFHSFLGNH